MYANLIGLKLTQKQNGQVFCVGRILSKNEKQKINNEQEELEIPSWVNDGYKKHWQQQSYQCNIK